MLSLRAAVSLMATASFLRCLNYLYPIPIAAQSITNLTWRVYAMPNDDMGGVGGGSMERVIALGAVATVLLYAALLPGALYGAFPRLPGKRAFLAARRALGVSSAVLGGLHGWHGCVDWVGGFENLRYWGADYTTSLALGALAWGITLALAATSLDFAVRALGSRWPLLHRGVYAAAVLVVAHAMMTTIHIVNLLPLLVAGFVAIEVLLLLEVLRARRAGWNWTPLLAALGAATLPLYWSFFLIGHHRH